MKICKYCGKENADANRFCEFCGGSFAASAEEEVKTAPENTDDGLSAETPPAVYDEAEFYDKCVPYRVKGKIQSLATYFWVCAAFNLFFAVLLGDWLSLLIAAADALLAIYIPKRKKGAAIAGAIYSGVGGLVMLLLQILGETYDFTVIIGWGASLILCVQSYKAMKAVDALWQDYLATGTSLMDHPNEVALDAKMRKNNKRGWIIYGALIAVILVVAIVVGLLGESVYRGLDAGAWNERIYKNDFFSLAYELPTGWNRLSDADIAEWNRQAGYTSLSGSGGVLFEAYEGNDYDAATKTLMLELVRHADTYTAKEVLDSWTADNRAYYDESDASYRASEYKTLSIGGKDFLVVEETASFSDTEEADGVYTVISYTCVYQFEEMTVAIEIWFYDVEDGMDTAKESEALLSGFMAVTVLTSATE